jgi:hypothetical protein
MEEQYQPKNCNSTETIDEPIDRLLEMYCPQYNWEQHYEHDLEAPEDLFRTVVQVVEHPEIESFSNNRYYDCGSVRLENTPEALYRLLYLTQPKQIDFSDLYKSSPLILLVSRCGRFGISLRTFKYQLALYFFCVEEETSGQLHSVQSAFPGHDIGIECQNREGKKFFEMVERSLDRTWGIDLGNDCFV